MENNYPQISVIVPVYNVEKYLPQCIDSILKQDFSDFELLLIDDGSKDKSGLICDEYAWQDKRVKVFHRENGGVSSARNLGIDHAQGKYIAFIDSDDYIDVDYFSILMRDPADLAVTGYVQFSNSNEDKIIYHSSFIEAIYRFEEFKDGISLLLNRNHTTPWNKLFKTKIIKEYHIYFDPKIRFAEDTVFVQTYLFYSNVIVFQGGMPYHYRSYENEDSFFRYNLTSNEYIHTMQMELQAYENLVNKVGLPNQKSRNRTIKDILLVYYRNISKSRFTFTGYSDYKRTMKMLCPTVSFGDQLYALSYRLVCVKMYFLSFFVLRFLYPLKLWIKHIS